MYCSTIDSNGVSFQPNVSAPPSRAHGSHIGPDAREGEKKCLKVELRNAHNLDVIGAYPHAARSDARRCLVGHIGFQNGEVLNQHIVGPSECQSPFPFGRAVPALDRSHWPRFVESSTTKPAASNTDGAAVIAAGIEDGFLRNLNRAQRSR